MANKNQNTEGTESDLAIHGGTVSVTEALPDWPPHLQSVAQAVAASVADGSWGQYHGQPLDEFREAFASLVSSQHVWPCASGTIAVELALRGLGVTPEHQVILAGYDFPGNFRAIEAIGARPMLIDVRQNGFVIDPALVEAGLTEKTKAIIVSHLHGQLADVNAIRSKCEPKGVFVLEDACQVPAATVDGRPAGSTGHAGVFSFGGSKLLTAGRGGAVVTNDEEVLQRIRIAAERGNDAFPLSALQAAALVPQLAELPEFNRKRLLAAKKLIAAMEANRLLLPLEISSSDEWLPAFYKFPIFVADPEKCDDVQGALVAEGVPAATGFRGFARRTARRCDKIGELTNSKRAASQTILLHHPCLLGNDLLLDQVIKGIAKVEKYFSAN